MATKQYLDQAGVERLVQNINLRLARKLNKDESEATLAGYATKADLNQVKESVTGVYLFKGSVADRAGLAQIQNPAIGDVYNIADSGMNVAWTGSDWDDFGTIADLSNYLEFDDVDAIPQNELTNILFSGDFGVASNVAEVIAMVANDEPEVEIVLEENVILDRAVIIPEGKKVTFDLDGNTLSATGATPVYSEGGEVVIKNGNVQSNIDAVAITNGGTLVLDNANITSSGRNGVSLTGGSEGVINSGSITSQEAGVAMFRESVVTINGGTITGIDNGCVMGNGTVGDKPNNGEDTHIVMNGGKLVAHIQSAGYIACGVYVPNSGSFTMNGGEIVSDGAGLVMRGGSVILNGGRIQANGASGVLGKVGDSQITVGPYAVVYEAKSRYPKYDTLSLTIGPNMILEGTDGDLNVLLGEGIEANITDNR